MKYDYHCTECGIVFETEQRMSDDLLKKCDACGKESLERLISGGVGILGAKQSTSGSAGQVSSGSEASMSDLSCGRCGANQGDACNFGN